jgi:hypothetical protein
MISGVWRPRDRDHYFEHDSSANIAAIGAYKKSIASIAELIALYRSGAVPPTLMLTFSCNIGPSTIGAPNGLASIADTVIAPLVAWRDSGLVVLTDFTSLIHAWDSAYGSRGYLYDAAAPVVGVSDAPRPPSPLMLAPGAPNPLRTGTVLRFSLAHDAHIRLAIFDVLGREVAVLADGPQPAGDHALRWDARHVPSGVYVCRLEERVAGGGAGGSSRTQKLLVVR